MVQSKIVWKYPPFMIRHIKNIGVDYIQGKGISKLGKDILEGVLNS